MEPRARKYPRLAGHVARENQQEGTPNRNNRREGIPRRRDQQERTTSQRDQQERNPRCRDRQEQERTSSQGDQQEGIPGCRDQPEGTPNLGNQPEGTPKHGDQQEGAPNHGDQTEVAPNHGDQLEVAPNHGDQLEVTPNQGDPQEVNPNLHRTANMRIRENTHTLDGAEDSEGTELQDMFQKLQGDIMKLIATKRRNVKLKINTSFKAIQEKLDELLKSHRERREGIYEEYALEFATFVNSSGEDVVKLKTEAGKLTTIFHEQQKTFQRYVIAHNQKMEAFQRICQCHFKNLNDLEIFHEDELITEKNALQQNMSSF